MQQRLVQRGLCLALAAAFGTGSAWALGFSRAQPSVTLGAPLDFSVGLRLDAGELLQPECVSAEVSLGDVVLPRSGVVARLESSGGQPSVRVLTQVRIDEPVVHVTITAGCEAKVTRRFTLFPDPPGLPSTMPLVVAPEAVPAAPAAPGGVSAPPAATSAPAARPPAAAAAAAMPAGRDGAPVRPRPRRDDAAAAGRVRATTERLTVDAGLPADRRAARLRLDAPSVTFAADQALLQAAAEREAALAAVRAAVGMAQAAADTASSRVAAMEASIESLKRESKANRDAMARLQASLAEADARGRWTPWLLAAVLALLGVAGWLYARLRRAEQARQEAWWSSAQTAEGPGSGAPSEAAGAPVAEATASDPEPSPARGAALPPPDTMPAADFPVEPAVPPTQATQPLPAGLLMPDSPLRDISIEELLDIEQQAEFFIVLGQDEAAVDLLMGHLRSTGGTSPLPYLKLLEIYQRRGDQEAYERIRRRFNDRFNSLAPSWDEGPTGGRSLEEYPDVLARLQQVWPHPMDAMAELQTLLFRGDGGPLFDLPAYRDVLFLYTLARDLHELIQQEGPAVDLLLPLGFGGARVDGSPDGGASVDDPRELPPLEMDAASWSATATSTAGREQPSPSGRPADATGPKVD